MKSQIDLQIDVLSGLTADQRKQLADLHPNMLATPWIRAGGPAMTRREAAAPSAPTPPAAAPPR